MLQDIAALRAAASAVLGPEDVVCGPCEPSDTVCGPTMTVLPQQLKVEVA